MIYRKCTIDDFDKLLPLFYQLWPDQQLSDASLKKVFNKGITSECQYYLCAEIDRRIVGFCSLTVNNNLWQQGNLGHIDELIVDESFFIKNLNARRTLAIKRIREWFGRAFVLCGTPAPNSPHDIVEQINIVDFGICFSGVEIPENFRTMESDEVVLNNFGRFLIAR